MADELYNLDSHLAEYIAAKLREFIEQETGFPGNYPDASSWHAKLASIAAVLESYTKRFDMKLDQELAVTRETQQALKDLAEIFPSLWI